MTENASATPTRSDERHELIDVVRGFALFGVMFANMAWTSQWVALTDAQREALPTDVADEVVGMLELTLVSMKFYTLFSMLFGLGFALLLMRSAGRGRDVAPVWVRRLAVLFVFGIAHMLLLWFGDILHIYALVGLLLVLFRNGSDRALLGWACGIALFVALQPFVYWLAITNGVVAAPEPESDELLGSRFAAMAHGGWSGVLAVNWQFAAEQYGGRWLGFDGNVYWYLSVLWKFLVGFVLGRRLVLQQSERHVALFRRVLPWALAIGVVGNVAAGAGAMLDVEIMAPSSPATLLWIPVEVAIFALSVAYLCAIALLYQRPAWRRRLAHLAPVGRMALTNYLSQSMFLVLLFYGVGVGLLGHVGTALCLAFCFVLFGLQVAVSAWWLARFRFGPMEWLWRCLTYGRRQPFRRVEAVG